MAERLTDLIRRWKRIQQGMRDRIEMSPLPVPRFVGGADLAFSSDKKWAYGVALVWDREEGRVVETARAVRPVEVPYVPTYLSFREGPVLEEVVGKLKHPFGVMTFDGQGYAHPRRCGLATYVGIKLGIPSIGVAKSWLIGKHAEVEKAAGSTAEMVDKGETVGVVLRTRDGVRPIYVSIGNRVDLESAVRIAMGCVTKYRVPEPTRRADIEVARVKREVGLPG